MPVKAAFGWTRPICRVMFKFPWMKTSPRISDVSGWFFFLPIWFHIEVFWRYLGEQLSFPTLKLSSSLGLGKLDCKSWSLVNDSWGVGQWGAVVPKRCLRWEERIWVNSGCQGVKEALGGQLFLEKEETDGKGKASPLANVYFSSHFEMDAYSWLARRALGQNTAFNQDIASCRLPLQIPFQHSSLPPIWFSFLPYLHSCFQREGTDKKLP